MAETLPPDGILKLGTRRSPLAMAQAHETRDRLCAAHGWTPDRVQLVEVLASGDRIKDRPLAEIGGKALWTKELDACLIDGRIDAAVHSMKDVETLRPAELAIAAILPRADKRDMLVGASSIGGIPQGARVGTSAPRRAAQLLHARSDCEVVTFRGNVATRLARLQASEADVTFLAKAGLDRLGEHGVGTPLDPAEFLPAPAQGAIGIETRADDPAVAALFAPLDHAPSRAEVMAERALLEALGGNCHSPIALLCDFAAGRLAMRAALFSPDGAERVEGEAEFAAEDTGAPARLAADLLSRASKGIRSVFSGPPHS